MSDKIGVGIVTYNRPDFFKQCYFSIDQNSIDELVVVNDGTPYNLQFNRPLIQHDVNMGVGRSKNDVFKHLLDAGCDHIFVVEDDIIIKRADAFKAYVDAAATSGLKHMMYGYHGPANKRGGIPNPRYIVDYGSTKIALNQHCVGAVCYYAREVLENVGLNDEKFVNAWEHVEHSLRIVKAGYVPAYWWWPDMANSTNYIDELACSEVNSTIRPRTDWNDNIVTGAKHFISKHGVSPVAIPDSSIESVKASLKTIYKQHAKR
jgi:GT2 family glycosyltransferase